MAGLLMLATAAGVALAVLAPSDGNMPARGAVGRMPRGSAHHPARPAAATLRSTDIATSTTTPVTTTTIVTTTGARTSTAAGGNRHGAPPVRYQVRTTSLAVTERASASTATGRGPDGELVRRLATVIRYPMPTSGAPFPLVVFSQGYDVSAESYAGLLQAWASAGYVVADPTYPLTDPATPAGVNESDIVNHPTDLRFVISALIADARDPRSPLYGRVDAGRVAIIGHSDGGDVTLAVAANTCCRDRRVGAAVILSGAELSAFGGTYYNGGSARLLVVQGSADTINSPGCSAQLYDQAPEPKYYLNIPGAEHQPPYLDPGATRTQIAGAVVAFLDAYVKHSPSRLRALSHARRLREGVTITSAAALAGAATACPGAP